MPAMRKALLAALVLLCCAPAFAAQTLSVARLSGGALTVDGKPV
jgi:hypothetical protein